MKNKIYTPHIMLCAHCKGEEKTITFWDNLENSFGMALCKKCILQGLKRLEEDKP